jgi:preprotein translocase subunit SecG
MLSAPRLILLYLIIVLVVLALRSGGGLGQSFSDGP